MSLREGQIGGVFRGWAKFDLSGFTELTLVFTRPDDTKLTVTTADGVTAPGVPVTDPDLGPLPANEYFEYTTVDGDIPAGSKGEWDSCGIYTDATPKVYPSAKGTFQVLEGCS